MRELDPRDFIDRVAEQELFRKLVMVESSARVLTICDGGGRGKSSLLRRLKYNCQYEMDPPVPSCLIELDRLHDPSAFTLTSALVLGFTVRGVNIGERFAKFNIVDQAIALRDYSLFEEGTAFRPRDPRTSATASAQMVQAGGLNAGMYQNIERAENVHIAPREDFSNELKRRAEHRCVAAFFDDLRTVCASTRMVVLLDGWERCNLALRTWIHDEMLGNHVLHPDRNLRPEKFRVVIAGRPHDPPTTRHGLRADEFRPLFRSDEEFSATVLSRKTLSEWGNDHISQFMTLNGCPEPSEAEVELIRQKLGLGWSLERILSLIDDYFRP